MTNESMNINKDVSPLNTTRKEPDYYNMNGLSPLQAMKQGLLSKQEYIGFLKGNVIKYVVRAGHKEDASEDIQKAIDYLLYMEKIIGKV